MSLRAKRDTRYTEITTINNLKPFIVQPCPTPKATATTVKGEAGDENLWGGGEESEEKQEEG
jgi:hypothetical protein